jgi:hypothetical protein
MLTLANGTAGRRSSEGMLKIKAKVTASLPVRTKPMIRPIMTNLRALNVTPHVTQDNGITKTGKSRRSAIDERTRRHQRYGIPQSRRAMIECIFGWGKQHGSMRKTKHRVICLVAADFMLNLIAYNLIPVPKLVPA